MRLRYGFLCDYAYGVDGQKIGVVGIFDHFHIKRSELVEASTMAPFYVVFSLGGGAFEVGPHDLTIRLIDADAKERWTQTYSGLVLLGAPGREKTATFNHGFINTPRLEPGDYSFELRVGATLIGDIPFSSFVIE